MAAIPHDVVNAFNAGKNKKRGSFASEYGRLMSYGLVVACKDRDGHVRLDPEDKIRGGYHASATTNIHLTACQGLGDYVTGETLKKTAPGTWNIS